MTEAWGWDVPPRYLVRDRDGAYGAAFIRRIRAMAFATDRSPARSPWQNGYAERLIGSIRREATRTSGRTVRLPIEGGNGAKPAEFGKMVKIAGGGVERWVGLGVIADNLINIGRKRQGSLNKPLAIIGFSARRSPPGGFACRAPLTTTPGNLNFAQESSGPRLPTRLCR